MAGWQAGWMGGWWEGGFVGRWGGPAGGEGVVGGGTGGPGPWKSQSPQKTNVKDAQALFVYDHLGECRQSRILVWGILRLSEDGLISSSDNPGIVQG